MENLLNLGRGSRCGQGGITPSRSGGGGVPGSEPENALTISCPGPLPFSRQLVSSISFSINTSLKNKVNNIILSSRFASSINTGWFPGHVSGVSVCSVGQQMTGVGGGVFYAKGLQWVHPSQRYHHFPPGTFGAESPVLNAQTLWPYPASPEGGIGYWCIEHLHRQASQGLIKRGRHEFLGREGTPGRTRSLLRYSKICAFANLGLGLG